MWLLKLKKLNWIYVSFCYETPMINNEIAEIVPKTVGKTPIWFNGSFALIAKNDWSSQISMFRRKKPQPQNEESHEPSHNSSPMPCSNCIKLMQEISQLREENNELKCSKQRKQYTIAPTLYTYYKNNMIKNRVSRLIFILFNYL